MAQKADDNHTPGGQPDGSDVTPRARPKHLDLHRLVRPIAVLPLHLVMTLNEAFAQAKSRLGADSLAAHELSQHALGGRLIIAARWIWRDGTEGALIFRTAFWQYFRISSYAEGACVEAQKGAFPYDRPLLSGQWYFFVGRNRFDRRYSTATVPSESTAPSKPEAQTSIRRGRKPFDWEIYKAKFYLMLYDDDVSVYGDINIRHYADRLITWGQNNFGEEQKVPEDPTMRKKISEWLPMWRTVVSADKTDK
jgi:hypothetical protein